MQNYLNMEIAQSKAPRTRDEFIKLLTELSSNEAEIAKTIVDILESQSLNTFSVFLRMEEIDKVCVWLIKPEQNIFNYSSYSSSKSANMSDIIIRWTCSR